MSKIIIQALPGTGKTTFAGSLESKGYRVLDTDSLWSTESGQDRSEEEVILMMNSHECDVVVTNLIMRNHGISADFIMYPEWNTWMETLLETRNDLVYWIGFHELKAWYGGYVNDPSAVELPEGAYLSSIEDQVLSRLRN